MYLEYEIRDVKGGGKANGLEVVTLVREKGETRTSVGLVVVMNH